MRFDVCDVFVACDVYLITYEDSWKSRGKFMAIEKEMKFIYGACTASFENLDAYRIVGMFVMFFVLFILKYRREAK